MKKFLHLVALACATALCLGCVAGTALALDVTKCTAKPNSEDGSVMGGMPTRITWEAVTQPDDMVQEIQLVLPHDTNVDPEDIQVTLLQGLDRIPTTYTANVSADESPVASIHFDTAVPADMLISVQLNNLTLPSQGGTCAITGSYIQSSGAQAALEPSQDIPYQATSTSEKLAAWLADQPFVQAWNSHTFLHLFFDPTIMVTSIPQVAQGWLTALGLVACGIPLAVPLGFLFCLLRMSKLRVLRAIASVYVNIVRGTPMFLQIYIAFFGLPLLGIALNNFLLGAMVMAINSGAYLCEIFRVGIQSIHKGQFEAARSLGMTATQTMRYVIVPQAFRRVLPTMTNEFILLYKDTSLLAAVGIMETVMFAKVITANTGNITPYIVAAMFYLIVTLPLSTFTRRLEEKTAQPASRPSPDKKSRPGRTKLSWTPAINAKRDVLAIKTADL